MRSALRSLFAVLLVLLVPAAACSQGVQPPATEERIASFISDVTIEANGDLDVTETMKINVLNQQINHGIYRDFPTKYRDKFGKPVQSAFEVVAVERDGRAEPWSGEELSNGVRVRIGSSDVIVPQGMHTYMLRYRVTDMIHYGKTYDELYWNVTGNGWIFPIDLAEASVKLPSKVAFTAKDFWTGPMGSTEQNAAVITDQPGSVVFRTNKPLDSFEGMTISVKFPKGVLSPPRAAAELSTTRDGVKTDGNS